MMLKLRQRIWRLRKDAAYRLGTRAAEVTGRSHERITRDRTDWTVLTGLAKDPEDVTEGRLRDVRTISRTDVTGGHPEFVADPFLHWHDGVWNLFVEVFDRRLGRGVIGLATSESGTEWTWRGTVLKEPFHLSYPCVFAAEDRTWMVPETDQASAVRLYVAEDFPLRWRHYCDLLQLPNSRDATIFAHGGLWWCFVETSASTTHDELRLFFSEQVDDPASWREHPGSPIVRTDAVRARPAGKPIVLDGALHRLSQDCGRRYGVAVRAHRIHELSPDSYREDERGRILLYPGCFGWNRNGSHHLDCASLPDGSGFLIVADGW